MSVLSNSVGTRDDSDRHWVDCRLVRQGEIEPALRLLLSSRHSLASDGQVLDFLSFSADRGIDTASIWVAARNDQIVWSMLPVPNPGRTMLLFTPARLTQDTPIAAVKQLAEVICDQYRSRGLHMAQLLIDPDDRQIIDLYRGAKFDELAELIYLQRSSNRRATNPIFPPQYTVKNYSAETHSLFKQMIQRSYEQSLDCPALNGKRDIEDVIQGHKATGEFDPQLWWVVCEKDQPIAALLLSSLPHSAALELVYLGVAVEARGTGVSDLLMKLAIFATGVHGKEHLSLAVDSKNEPALKLYYRHGLKRIGARVALLRDLKA